jgi:predicted nucleic acid-binding protein
MSASRVFLDTNVLVYLHDESEPAKRKRSAERLAAELTRSELVVSTQVLQELYVALTRGPDPIRLPELAEQAVRDTAKLTVVQVDAPMVFEAITLCRAHQLSFWDALLIEAARSAGCSTILTEDLSHGQTLAGVRVENPFAEEARPTPRKVKRRTTAR